MNYKNKIVCRYYYLEKEMVINGRKFTEIVINPHFEKNHSYMNDNKILEIVKQIDKKMNLFLIYREYCRMELDENHSSKNLFFTKSRLID